MSAPHPAQSPGEPSGAGVPLPDDSVPDAAVPETTGPAGAFSDGALSAGAFSDGALPDGTVPEGPVPGALDLDGAPVLLAEPGQRLLARIVDTLVVGLPVIVVVRQAVSGHDVDVVAPPAVAGCLLLYEAVQLAVWGRTLGKRFAGIEVAAAPRDQGAAQRPEAALPDAAVGPGSAVEPGGRLGVLRAVLRAAVYALPVAVRPVPVLGLLAGLFWVANAGAMYEGTRRQAVHDRLAGTLVVKRPRRDSPRA
ncbi:RDD family protein [Actinomadura roseirufa]|uniref:RDD family protein n=1 Tax=Actinomadura roseirufa TaxID=2094049 RepID=UPI0010410A00|nr:RDD family protein [Actinomadura roseirufa]